MEEHNHAYILIDEIISDALAHGLSFPLDTVNSSENDYVEIKVMRWSDDFEPVTGTKSNRGTGIWITSLTLIPSTGERSCKKHNTYILAVGKKGENHHCLEKNSK